MSKIYSQDFRGPFPAINAAMTSSPGSFKSLRSRLQRDASPLALVQSAPFFRGDIKGKTIVWIKLTEPGGNLIHINVEHVTSARADTQIPGARAQLDLASGKFQGVQENVEQVMQLISVTSGARENDETT
jgi:hypothetical protein